MTMNEIELKFLVFKENQQKLAKQVSVKSAKQQTLLAYYFDTEENILAKQGIALRSRYENEQWVQTLKMSGDGISKRIEMNVALPVQTSQDMIEPNALKPNLTFFDDETIQKKLEKIMPIDKLNQLLTVKYCTKVHRISRTIKKNGSIIEIAYDQGEVSLGDMSVTQPIHEIEFELLKGEMNDLLDIAKTWCKRHKLCFSTITKAQRGSILLANKTFAEPQRADLTTLHYEKNITQQAFLQQVVNNCLQQILVNASVIAEGAYHSEHIHQLRVGIRRLRTALKILQNFSDMVNPEWRLLLKQTFSVLGQYRDREILKNHIQPMLEQAFAPVVEWSAESEMMPVEAVRDNNFQQLLLELIAFTYLPVASDSPDAKSTAIKKNDKIFRKTVKSSENFANLDIERRHQVRKNLKALRYMSEFIAPLTHNNEKVYRKKLKMFVKYIKPAQNLLGDYNDNMMCHSYYLERAKIEPKAWFAVGWFCGRENYQVEACVNTLKLMKKAPKFW